MPRAISVQHRRRQRRAVAFDLRLELQALAHRHDRHAVPADIAGQQDHVAHAHARGRHHGVVLDEADAGGVDEQPVALAPVHHLGIARHEQHAGGRGRRLHRLHDALQHLHRQPLFEDEAGAQEQRARAAHRQVVDRAVHGQRADVAAGEEQRADDVGVGGERQPRIPSAAARRRDVRRARRSGTPA